MLKISRFSFIFLAVAVASVFALKLGYLPLIFEEPRRALVSLEMMLSGNYVVPKINGFEYYNKPPFYNWLLVVFYKLFGTNDWVGRLPTYLSLFAIARINFSFFKSKIGVEPALFSSFFFLLSAHVLFYFSFIGEIDITYSLIVYGQVLVFFYFHDKNKIGAMFGWSYALMSLGFMTKGLPSIAFQGLTIIGVAIYYRKWVYLIHPANFFFLSASLFCIFGYFRLYSAHSDPLPYIAQLINESSRRTSFDFIKTLINPLKVLGEFLKITFPWCLLAVPLFFKRNRQVEPNKWITYGLLFVLANSWLYFLSSGTRDRYLYMFLPFIYNALAFYLTPILSNKPELFKKGTIGFSMLLCILFFYLAFSLETSIWWPILFSLAFGIVVVLFAKKKCSTMLALFGLMLIARLAYDVIVFPSRKESLNKNSSKAISQDILEVIGDETLYFYTSFSTKENSLPVFGAVGIPQIERLPYDLSFYVGQMSGKAIVATDRLEKEYWYVSLENKINPDQAVKINFRLEKKEWVVFKK